MYSTKEDRLSQLETFNKLTINQCSEIYHLKRDYFCSVIDYKTVHDYVAAARLVLADIRIYESLEFASLKLRHYPCVSVMVDTLKGLGTEEQELLLKDFLRTRLPQSYKLDIVEELAK